MTKCGERIIRWNSGLCRRRVAIIADDFHGSDALSSAYLFRNVSRCIANFSFNGGNRGPDPRGWDVFGWHAFNPSPLFDGDGADDSTGLGEDLSIEVAATFGFCLKQQQALSLVVKLHAETPASTRPQRSSPAAMRLRNASPTPSAVSAEGRCKAYPTTKQIRSGDLGEIFAMEWIDAYSGGFRPPVKRLRWRNHRNIARSPRPSGHQGWRSRCRAAWRSSYPDRQAKYKCSRDKARKDSVVRRPAQWVGHSSQTDGVLKHR